MRGPKNYRYVVYGRLQILRTAIFHAVQTLLKYTIQVVMVYVHVCMCERDTVGRGYQYVGHTMQATETG